MLYLAHSLGSLPRQTKKVNLLFRPVIRYTSSKNGKGPSNEKLKAIPFAQHIKAAEKVMIPEKIMHTKY